MHGSYQILGLSCRGTDDLAVIAILGIWVYHLIKGDSVINWIKVQSWERVTALSCRFDPRLVWMHTC